MNKLFFLCFALGMAQMCSCQKKDVLIKIYKNLKGSYRTYNSVDDISNFISTVTRQESLEIDKNISKSFSLYFLKINNPYLNLDEDQISKEEITDWFKETGISNDSLQKVLIKYPIKGWSTIINALEKDAPIELKQVIISDYLQSPEIIKQIFLDLNLLRAYSRVIVMSSMYRTNLEFLLAVSENKLPVEISTIDIRKNHLKLNEYSYKKKVVEIPFSSGLIVKGVFIEFSKGVLYEKTLEPDKLFKTTDYLKNYGFMHFQEALSRNEKMQLNFESKDLKELINRELLSVNDSTSHNVPNYSWRLTEYGTMQLVETSLLKNIIHPDGFILFGALNFE